MWNSRKLSRLQQADLRVLYRSTEVLGIFWCDVSCAGTAASRNRDTRHRFIRKFRSIWEFSLSHWSLKRSNFKNAAQNKIKSEKHSTFIYHLTIIIVTDTYNKNVHIALK